jgi:beta-glucosidase
MFGTMATLAFPSENLLVSTWNLELAKQMSNSMAREAVTYNINIWYAPAVNIHRSALGARNFEYFSEDPLISGKMGAAFIQGARDQGLVLTVKHFALNEQESNRATYGLYTWASEQAMREIYLKGFEISIKEGQPYGVMTALNRVGSNWSSASKALVTDLLREEWGYLGFVTSDATTSATGGYASVIDSLMAGNDGTLSMFNTGSTIKTLKEGYEKEPDYTTYLMQQAMHNIGYMILQTGVVSD